MKTRNIYYRLLRDYLIYWQKALRLTDWQIEYRINEDENFFGTICTFPTHSTARIEIRDPDLFDGDVVGIKDLEVTLVHELLHLRFFHCTHEGKAYHNHKEMAIKITAAALVAAKRGISVSKLK